MPLEDGGSVFAAILSMISSASYISHFLSCVICSQYISMVHFRSGYPNAINGSMHSSFCGDISSWDIIKRVFKIYNWMKHVFIFISPISSGAEKQNSVYWSRSARFHPLSRRNNILYLCVCVCGHQGEICFEWYIGYQWSVRPVFF